MSDTRAPSETGGVSGGLDADRSAAGPRRPVATFLRRHWAFLLILAAGIALRVVATLAYRPALFFVDSVRYLKAIEEMNPTGRSPLGYTVLLLAPVLLTTRHLVFAAIANHVVGLLTGVGGYVLLRRFGVWRWVAALAVAPVLLDAYQVQIEELIMSDALFTALSVLLLLVLARRGEVGYKVAAVAGLVLAAAALTRLVGLAAVAVAVGYVLLVGRTWRKRLLAAVMLAVTYAVPLAGYAVYFHAWSGSYRVTDSDVMAQYGLVATFADCRGLDLPSYERVLCDPRPVGERPGSDWYINDKSRPAKRLHPPAGVSTNAAIADFTRRVIRHQPWGMVQAVGHNFLRGFAWSKTTQRGEPELDRWKFPSGEYHHSYDVTKYVNRWGGGGQHVNHRLAAFLVDYQRVGFVRGTALGGCLLLALGGAVGLGRARRSGMRAVTALAAGVPVSALLVAANVEFSWRYQLPALVLLPLAGALGLTAMLRRPDVAPTRAAAPSGTDDAETDAAALREFSDRHGEAQFAPVVVVIAAYEEERGIGGVVQSIPEKAHGMAVDVLVVDDGSLDATAVRARRHGAYVCRPARNRGQGAALRLGYRLARERGARYVVTTDADGQYDVDQLETLLAPIVEGRADFVTGSRALGQNDATDPVRRVGTVVFAGLVSLLTGIRVTDTSFGFRAMRAELTGAVTLAQSQYQSSELLIGVLARGFRVVELPMRMRHRNQGSSKKGNNLVYGLRYARVVVSTWWRERGRPNSRSSSTNRAANSTP
ncbi:MAG: glycosyltransferase family 2 protein [Streptosporangiales bacterium]|nr:glycosyltransferase family 2 protein [Streptosporangiales bacterium]